MQIVQEGLFSSQEKRGKKGGKDHHLVKVCDDLIQQPQALHPHVVAIQLNVEIIEVWNWGKQDADLCVRLVVQVLMQQGKKKSAKE